MQCCETTETEKSQVRENTSSGCLYFGMNLCTNLFDNELFSMHIRVGQFVRSKENREMAYDFQIFRDILGVCRPRNIALSRILTLLKFTSR